MEMLKLIPDTPLQMMERCSGHGGTFGVMKETHSSAKKVGRPVFRQAQENNLGHIVSDCPLAALHIVENVKAMAAKDGSVARVSEPEHPIEIMARAFGLLGA